MSVKSFECLINEIDDGVIVKFMGKPLILLLREVLRFCKTVGGGGEVRRKTSWLKNLRDWLGKIQFLFFVQRPPKLGLLWRRELISVEEQDLKKA